MRLPSFTLITITDSDGKTYDFPLEAKVFSSGNDGYSANGKMGPTGKEFQASFNITRIARCQSCGKSRGSHPWLQGKNGRGCDDFVEEGSSRLSAVA